MHGRGYAYFHGVFIALDQAVNAAGYPLFNLLYRAPRSGPFGDPDETISSVLGKVRLLHGGRVPWHHPVVKALGWALDRWDPGHLARTVEYDEGTRVPHRREAKR